MRVDKSVVGWRRQDRRRGTETLLLAVAAIALAACDEEGSSGTFAATDGLTSPRSAEIVERDVEAPDIFQVTEAALWDGRPSLGGVWVAHPDVDEPQRVLIYNISNDRFVTGALFRREREYPGPRIQVSSDAAAQLGMLAGAPVPLKVTALRPETSEAEAATDPISSGSSASRGDEALVPEGAKT